jgi:CHAT domain-containing protein
VVLSGCDTARSSTDAAAESVGLAQAFVAAGAATAIAAARPVDDDDTARLMALLHENLAHLDPAEALRSAQLSLRAERPQADWAAFRVIVP